MREERIDLLLQYLDTLRKLDEGMYTCPKEIKKAIEAIEKEFDI